MDIVYIRGLRVDTVIGVYPDERRRRQTVVIDLEMAADTRRAASADDLENALDQALDYAAVSRRVHAFVAAAGCRLIEALAEEVAALVMAEFDVAWLRLGLAKPGAVPEADAVGVVIERGRRT